MIGYALKVTRRRKSNRLEIFPSNKYIFLLRPIDLLCSKNYREQHFIASYLYIVYRENPIVKYFREQEKTTLGLTYCTLYLRDISVV